MYQLTQSDFIIPQVPSRNLKTGLQQKFGGDSVAELSIGVGAGCVPSGNQIFFK